MNNTPPLSPKIKPPVPLGNLKQIAPVNRDKLQTKELFAESLNHFITSCTEIINIDSQPHILPKDIALFLRGKINLEKLIPHEGLRNSIMKEMSQIKGNENFIIKQSLFFHHEYIINTEISNIINNELPKTNNANSVNDNSFLKNVKLCFSETLENENIFIHGNGDNLKQSEKLINKQPHPNEFNSKKSYISSKPDYNNAFEDKGNVENITLKTIEDIKTNIRYDKEVHTVSFFGSGNFRDKASSTNSIFVKLDNDNPINSALIDGPSASRGEGFTTNAIKGLICMQGCPMKNSNISINYSKLLLLHYNSKSRIIPSSFFT